MDNKKIVVMVITVVFILATGILYCINGTPIKTKDCIVTDMSEPVSTDKESSDTSSTKEATKKKGTICVHICGQVKNPGVYEVEEADRVSDVIRLAGGFTKKASPDSINQAQHLTDGQQIYVPSKEEANHINMGESNETSLININTASLDELMTLPGIGESKAKSIIKFREENQGFQTIEDIKKIEGIKDGVYKKIKDYITN